MNYFERIVLKKWGLVRSLFVVCSQAVAGCLVKNEFFANEIRVKYKEVANRVAQNFEFLICEVLVFCEILINH